MKNYVIIIALMFLACDRFQYSDYQVLPNEAYQDINAKNIDKFIQTTSDTLTLAVIGDSQRYFDATDDVITKINNTPGIDFVVHTGDLVDFGLQKEYIQMHELFTKLDYPYVAVVGNHDLIGNGGEVYQQMYGDLNFSFTVNGNRFVYINTNHNNANPKHDIPDINWLDKTLSDTANYDQAMIVCHISPLNPDFNPDLKDTFIATIDKYKKVLLSMNGHYHNFSFTKADQQHNVSHLNTDSTSKKTFILLKIWKGDFSFQLVS